MKKLIFILLLFTIASAWRTTIDSMQVRNFFRFYKFPNDQFLFVNSSDSTFDTAGVVAEKFGIRDITFPQLISFDTAYSGCYVYVPNSDQALLLSAGTTTWNPDSGAYIAIEGMNTGATGDLFMAAGNTGNIDFYGLNNFKFFNGVDTLRFTYNSGDDGFVINSKRVEIVGRDGVGHGIAIDSQYVLIDDTLIITDFIANDERTGYLFFDEYGNVGIGTTNPRIVDSYTYSTATHMFNIYDASNESVVSVQGGDGARLSLIDLGGAADYKWSAWDCDEGIVRLASYNDNGSSLNPYIIVANIGTGNVGIGTNIPDEKLHVSGNIKSSGTVYADSIYGTKIGTNASAACSLKDGSTLRATGNAFWHRAGKAFRVQIPELSGNVTSGQITRIYFAAGTLPTPITSNVYKTIWVNGEGSYEVKCACYGGSAALIICADPGLTSLGNLTPLTINEFTFEYIVY